MIINGGCPVCGNIGCTECGAPAIVDEAEVRQAVANMADEQARFGSSIELKGGFFVPKVVVPVEPEMQIDG